MAITERQEISALACGTFQTAVTLIILSVEQKRLFAAHEPAKRKRAVVARNSRDPNPALVLLICFVISFFARLFDKTRRVFPGVPASLMLPDS